MNYDKNSFLSGVAVGRQMKGWASGGGVALPVREVRIATGEKETICTQGSGGGFELNTIQLPAGTQYVCISAPDGSLYAAAVAEEPFTLYFYANDSSDGSATANRFQYGGKTVYFATDGWTTPLPTPLVPFASAICAYGYGNGHVDAKLLTVQGLMFILGLPE